MAIVLPSPKAPIENGRVLERVDKPFVYGTAAFWQGKTESQNSHKWTVYVRGLENEDLSYYIKSVTFQLHTSFDQSTRGKHGTDTVPLLFAVLLSTNLFSMYSLFSLPFRNI